MTGMVMTCNYRGQRLQGRTLSDYDVAISYCVITV